MPNSTTIEAQSVARYQPNGTAIIPSHCANTAGNAGALTLTIPGTTLSLKVTWGTAKHFECDIAAPVIR